jgi:hypothetical protein
MSIRLRLTLWYAGLLTSVLLAFSGLFYWVLTANLSADIDRTLDHFTQETHLALGHTADGSWLEHTTAINLDSLSVNDFSSPGVYVQVVDDRGRVLALSSNLSGGQLPVQLEDWPGAPPLRTCPPAAATACASLPRQSSSRARWLAWCR